MLKLRKIAVTGNIASGKTTVCVLFKELGAYTLSADEIVHQLLSPETDLGQKIISLLGADVIVKGEFCREEMAKKVFLDRRLLHHLEELLHPEVQKEIETRYQKIASLGSQYCLFVVEVPLLFESRQESFYDRTIAVVADEKIREKRFLQKGRCSKEEFQRREKRLLTQDEKAKRADFLLENNTTKKVLKEAVTKLFKQLKDHGRRK